MLKKIEYDELEKQLFAFVDSNPLNRADEIRLERIYDRPLIGIAAARDPLFAVLKNPEVIGPHHLLPAEWLEGAETVISYFLPFSEKVRRTNREGEYASPEWLYARYEGEIFNNTLRVYLADLIKGLGGNVVVPAIDSRFELINRRSNWSERHAAFIAGLGTFGLSKSLLTSKGCAGRFGSVITDIPLAPTKRNYQEVYEYCTMCGQCISRCPKSAITFQGKNIELCGDYLDYEVKVRFAPRYGCGKCQTAIPCEYELP